MLLYNWISLFLMSSSTTFVNAKRFKRSPILEGLVAEPHEFPYTVAIISSETGYICTGGIIGERYILSAAHCFTDKTNQFKTAAFMAFPGTNNYNLALDDPNSIAIPIETIFIPSDFHYKTRRADISILELAEDLRVKENKLEILTLPFKFRNTDIGERAVAAAFGACGINVSLNGTNKIVDSLIDDGRLRYATIEIINKAECHDVPYGNFSIGYYHLLGKMISNSTEIYGMCYGDSGSPLVYKSKTVIEVMVDAFDQGCDGRTLPIVFTKVRSYLPFIRNVLEGNITQVMHVKKCVYNSRSNENTERGNVK